VPANKRDADTRQRALQAVAAGRKVVDAAREFGIAERTLSRWRQQQRAADGDDEDVMLEPLFDWDEHDRWPRRLPPPPRASTSATMSMTATLTTRATPSLSLRSRRCM